MTQTHRYMSGERYDFDLCSDYGIKEENMIYTVSKTRNDGVGHRLAELLNIDKPIVFVSLQEDLDFNEDILGLAGKPYVLMSFIEMGYDWDRKEGHHFGVNTQNFPNTFHYETWKVFDEFVRDNPPVITFCREALEKDITPKYQPISYPCFIAPQPIQSEDEFNNRIFEVFNTFGISHEYRKELHGQIWQQSGKHGYSVADNLYILDHFIQYEKGRKWASIHIPWWARQPIEVITERNKSAKIGISIAGAGRSCFRHTEIPTVSAMLMWDDNLAWHKGIWEHGVNCIKCEQGKEIETAMEWLQKPKELYQIYVKGTETVDQFRFDNYVPYLQNLINNA
jgi:hypothetical protein